MAAPAAVLSILVRANTGQAVSGLARVNTQLGATQAKSSKALGAIKTLAKGAAIGAAGGIGYAVKKAADFEQQLDSLGSVANASGKQMGQLRKQAMKAGADTKFSALEAAKAQTELAKGGLSVAQISKGALKSSLALAAAGEMELADAAETTANALKLFGLEGKDTMKVADALATAANATTADVSDFAMALKQGGGVAKMAGLSFTETVLALEALAETGVRNSDAGTSMKTAFIQLLKPSEKQAALAKELGLNFVSASGGMKSMSSISEMLRSKMGGMTKAQRTAALATIAGTDGVRTLNALYAAGPAKLDKMKAGLDKTGTAAQVAAKKQDNLKGKLENLQGSVETAAIAIGTKWLPVLTRAAKKITDIINDPKMTGGQKFDALAKMAGGAFSAAIPKVADAAAKAAPVVLRAFIDGFRNSSLWGKLIIGGFLLHKMGGLGSFTGIGRKAGGAMGQGMADTAATTAGRTMPGKFAGLRSRMAGIGKNVLGAALVMGVADAVTKQGISGIGDRFQQGASTATLGFLPAPKDIDTRMQTIAARVQAWKGSGQLKLSDPGDPANSILRAKDVGDFTGKQRQIMVKMAELRNTATQFFGPGTKLFSDAWANPARATKDLRTIGFNLDGLRTHVFTNLRGIKAANAETFAAIQRSMGVHTKAGKEAVQKNFAATVTAIQEGMKSGTISTKDGMAAILQALRRQSGLGKAAIGRNYNAIERQIHMTMSKSGKLTKEGTAYMRAVMVDEMKALGLSSGSISMSLNKKASAQKGFTQPGQTGLVVRGGKSTGDSVHALLERGEVVINRTAVKKMGGPQHVNRINQMVPRFQKGGVPLSQIGGQPGGVQTIGNEGLGKYNAAANRKLSAAKKKADEVVSGGGEVSTTGLVAQVKRALAWARSHGWKGQVNSGFRSREEQAMLYARYLAGGNIAAKPGSSSHEKGQAVDVSDVPGFARAMASAPGNAKLRNLVPGDALHFSVSGHQKGGIVGMASGGIVARAARGAGFRGGNLLRAVAESKGESGWNERAVGDGGWSKGLMQIYTKVHPWARGMNLFDPATNMKAAMRIFKSQGWGAWHADHTPHIGAARAAIASMGSGGGGAPGKKVTPKQRKKMSKQLKKKLRRIKGTGLSKKTEANLKRLTQNAAIYGEYADRAGTLTGSEEGAASGAVNGVGETGWLQKQLDTLFSLRNALIRAEAAVVVKREGASKELEKAYEWLRAHPLSGTKKGKDPTAGWKGVSPATGSMNAWNKQPIKKRKERMGKFIRQGGRLPSDRRFLADGRLATDRSGAGRQRQVEDLKKKVIPALKTARSGLNTRRGELLSSLETVQGLGAPAKVLKSLPAIGALGGEIFSAQTRLRDLGVKATSTDTAPAVDTTRADLLAGLLRESNLRTAVSQRQYYEAFRNMPPFGGQFAQGGVVPGAVGAPRMILAHGGETVTPAGGGEIHLHFAPGTEWLRDFVDVRVEQGTRKQARAGGRVLPGRGGGG